MIDDLLAFLFAVSQRPCLKKRYQRRAKKVKEYLESVKDFDELISPQSLFLHFLGLELSTKVQKNLEVVKKSKHFFLFFFLFLLSLFLYIIFLSFQEWRLGLASRNWLRPKRRRPRVAPSMISCQRKRQVMSLWKILWRHFLLPTHLPNALPHLQSLDVIVSGGKEVRKKKKAGVKSFLPTFWDDSSGFEGSWGTLCGWTKPSDGEVV